MTKPPVPGIFLDEPGAVAGRGPDQAVAWHYGDPVREQRLLVEGLAVVDLSHRGVVTVSGPDRLSWLHSLTTQHLTALTPRQSTEALILSPKGHIEHALHLVDDGDTTWITTEPGAADAVTAWLFSMRFMLRVEVTNRSMDFAVLGEPIDREGTPHEPMTWRDTWPGVAEGSVAYATTENHPGAYRPWREVLVPRATAVHYANDRPRAGTWATEALRVAAWRPRSGWETDHRTIPHEADWLRTAVHLQKGCYRGQETVARVHNLGRPPRRLTMLHLDGSEHRLPNAGDAVLLGERAVGHVTTSARHYELGPIALAMVKRTTALDSTLSVSGLSASQEPIVMP
ncbi:MAG: YgfZ/GcvT domain-containing protein [Actinomycetota bacterium]